MNRRSSDIFSGSSSEGEESHIIDREIHRLAARETSADTLLRAYCSTLTTKVSSLDGIPHCDSRCGDGY